MLEITKILAERNLPVEFTEYLTAENSESTLERIKTFEKKYKAAILIKDIFRRTKNTFGKIYKSRH